MNVKERELTRSTLVVVDAINKMATKHLASAIFINDSLIEELKQNNEKLKTVLKQLADIPDAKAELYRYINDKKNRT